MLNLSGSMNSSPDKDIGTYPFEESKEIEREPIEHNTSNKDYLIGDLPNYERRNRSSITESKRSNPKMGSSINNKNLYPQRKIIRGERIDREGNSETPEHFSKFINKGVMEKMDKQDKRVNNVDKISRLSSIPPITVPAASTVTSTVTLTGTGESNYKEQGNPPQQQIRSTGTIGRNQGKKKKRRETSSGSGFDSSKFKLENIIEENHFSPNLPPKKREAIAATHIRNKLMQIEENNSNSVHWSNDSFAVHQTRNSEPVNIHIRADR